MELTTSRVTRGDNSNRITGHLKHQVLLHLLMPCQGIAFMMKLGYLFGLYAEFLHHVN
jgi:hypothetical protein